MDRNELDRLILLSRNAKDALLDGRIEGVIEYLNIKKQIDLYMADKPAMIGSVSPEESKLINEILQNDSRINAFLKKFLSLDSTEIHSYDDLNEAAINMFYSWFSGSDYVEAMIKIGRIFIDKHFDREFEDIFSEARNCYAFQQYRAATMMCRMLLEKFCIYMLNSKDTDIPRDKRGFIRYSASFSAITDDDDLAKEELINLYRTISKITHGKSKPSSKDTEEIFKRTIKAIEWMALR